MARTHGGFRIVISSPHGSMQEKTDELEAEISELMLKGWCPYFGLVYLNNLYLAQVLLFEPGEEE